MRVRAKAARYLRSRNFTIGAVLCLVVFATALVSLFYTPYSPSSTNIARRLEAPSREHLFGTDHFGRDIFSRVLVGARTSVSVGIVSVFIGLSVGVICGLIAGFYGGWVDEVIMRFMDGVYGFPAVLLAILFTSVLGPSVENAMIAIGLAYSPLFARLTRANILSLREREFALAAKAAGRGSFSIARRHLLPNTFPILIVQATIGFATAVLAEAALSYLGLGTQPPHPSWGRMLREAQTFMRLSVWPAVFPGIAIMVAVLAFNMLGDGLRDILDPRIQLLKSDGRSSAA